MPLVKKKISPTKTREILLQALYQKEISDISNTNLIIQFKKAYREFDISNVAENLRGINKNNDALNKSISDNSSIEIKSIGEIEISILRQSIFEIENSDIASFETHSEKLETEIKIHGGTCTTCVKKKTGSGEVTVQFRAKNRKLLQVEIDSATTVAFSLASSMNIESKDAYLSEIIENHGGLDFYFGNDLIAETFIQKLKNIWIGHYEKNFKLITEDADEKRVYSVTHLYRIPNIIPAELIEFENRLASVISVNKNGVLIKFLNTKTTKLTKKWDKLVAIDPSPELVKKLVVSENHKENSYLIMDMNNYQTEELAKDFFINKLETSQEYDFYKWKDNYYLPPK